MRLSTLVGIVAVASVAFWSAPVSAAEQSSAPEEKKAPTVIVFSSGTWHLVTSLELKDGSVIYTKPGEYPRAVPEYKVDRRRTAEVNQALEELVEVCLTDRVDFARIAGLKGRSLGIFTEASKRTMPKCLAAVREQGQRAEAAAQERAKQESLSGLEDAETSASLQHADKVVLTNRSVATTARHADGYGAKSKDRVDHDVEYADLAPEVIAEDCRKEAVVGTAQYTTCHDRQTAALERIEGRTPGSVPKNVFLDIRHHCREEWIRDYHKRDNCESDEIGAYISVRRLTTDPRYDPVFLNRIRIDCERTWSTSYTMQEGCLEQMLEGAPKRK